MIAGQFLRGNGQKSACPPAGGVSDRLARAHAIEATGIERSKAESVATAIAHFIDGGGVATTQLDAAKAELNADLDVAKAELKADIEGVKSGLKATEVALHAALAPEVAWLIPVSNASTPMSSASVIARFVARAFW
jgi:hypothetical protein